MSETSRKKISILAVEDDPGDFGLIQAYARMAKFGDSGGKASVTWAQTLAEGITAGRSNNPDVALLDLSLPDSAGSDTVRAMRAALPGVPIVVLTGHDDDALALAALQAGAQDYLIKRLFHVFQRLQSREAYEGTGIGLALCRKIAEHHKGRIWAESAGEGLGSRFCVVLPVPQEVA